VVLTLYGEKIMASILTSLGRTVLAGFILALIIVILFGTNVDVSSAAWQTFFFRWLHIISGECG